MVELRKIFHFLLGKNVDGHQLKAVDNLPPEMRLNNDVGELVEQYKDERDRYGSPTYGLAQLAGGGYRSIWTRSCKIEIKR